MSRLRIGRGTCSMLSSASCSPLARSKVADTLIRVNPNNAILFSHCRYPSGERGNTSCFLTILGKPLFLRLALWLRRPPVAVRLTAYRRHANSSLCIPCSQSDNHAPSHVNSTLFPQISLPLLGWLSLYFPIQGPHAVSLSLLTGRS